MDDATTALRSEPSTTSIRGEQQSGEMDAWTLLAKYFRAPKVLLTTLAFVTAIVYSGTLFFQFVWDDGPQIVDNPLIRSWHSLTRVFASDLWYPHRAAASLLPAIVRCMVRSELRARRIASMGLAFGGDPVACWRYPCGLLAMPATSHGILDCRARDARFCFASDSY